MRKKLIAVLSMMLVGAVCIPFTACTNQSAQDDTTFFDVATSLGNESSKGSLIGDSLGQSTEARKLYEEAKADGYTGSFVDFLKEIQYNVTVDYSHNISEALLSAVAIDSKFTESKYTYGGGMFGPSYRETTVISSGSGVIYQLDREAGDAYIITNYHVVYDLSSTGNETVAHISDDIVCYLYGGIYGDTACSIPATYVGGAMEYDIAVLKVENNVLIQQSDARAVRVADSDVVSAGETVYAIGNPDSEGISVTQGVVSVDAEYITMTSCDETTQVSRLEIRTDAAVNHGNSGGGLFNIDGSLVGIVNARSEESGVEAFGYAIPSNLAVAVAQNILDNSTVNESRGAMRATLGITLRTKTSQSVFNEERNKTFIVETIVVQSVSSGCAATDILQAGDIIYSMKLNDGEPTLITRQHMIGNMLFNTRMGDTIEIVVYRNGEAKTVTVTFDKNSYFTIYA